MNIPLDWDKITDGVPEFSFKDTTKKAKVVSVYDGDTVKIVFPLQEKLYKWNCRLAGVDTPELRTRNKLEKAHGYLVRDKLREKIWFVAPLTSSLIGSTLDTFLFFSIAFYGTGINWIMLSFGDLCVKILVALLMLIPFRIAISYIREISKPEKNINV